MNGAIKVYDDNMLIKAWHDSRARLKISIQKDNILIEFVVYCEPVDWKKIFNTALAINGFKTKSAYLLNKYGISDSILQMEIRSRRRMTVLTDQTVHNMFDNFDNSRV